MIKCYFAANGYYIAGSKMEAASLVGESKSESDPLQRLYMVLTSLLTQLNGAKDNVTVYNDSRVIDDLNGKATLDPWYTEAISFIRRRLLPNIKGVVFFKKMANIEIYDQIHTGSLKLGLYGTDALRGRVKPKNQVSSLKARWNHGSKR